MVGILAGSYQGKEDRRPLGPGSRRRDSDFVERGVWGDCQRSSVYWPCLLVLSTFYLVVLSLRFLITLSRTMPLLRQHWAYPMLPAQSTLPLQLRLVLFPGLSLFLAQQHGP